VSAPAPIPRAVFDEWRMPRFGTDNPTRHDNELWASLVRDPEPINAYQVNKRFGYAGRGEGPTWCFDRFGRTTTTIPDGRTLHVAGEHEDYYDPDFYIYNDVIVVAPDNTVAIYGYPRAAFPPTDFHTATLVGNQLWLVGNLGYADARKPGTTQVCRLDLTTMAIERLQTHGDPPGWIHKHEAALEGNAIVVRRGLVDPGGELPFAENIDDWALDLATLAWTRRTARDWQRFGLRRRDGKRTLLWELRQLLWHREHPDFGRDMRERYEKELPHDPDLTLLATLYVCDGATPLDEHEDEYNVYRIELDGVHVRFTEDGHRIAAMVEGRLADDRLRMLQDHVIDRLTALHATAWELES